MTHCYNYLQIYFFVRVTSKYGYLLSGLKCFQRVSLLPARATHSGDWLLVLPITACKLRLDDEAMLIPVALRLGSDSAEVLVTPLGVAVRLSFS